MGRRRGVHSLSRLLGAERHGLCGGLRRLSRPGYASDVTADAVVRVAAQAAATVLDHRRLGGQDAAAPDAAAAPSVVVLVFAVLRWLVVVLVMGVLVVHNLVVMVVLAPLDVVPYLECVGQCVDHSHDQELAHQYRLDGHEDHLDLLFEQVDTE